MVPPGGIEPTIYIVKGCYPKPLDEGGLNWVVVQLFDTGTLNWLLANLPV